MIPGGPALCEGVVTHRRVEPAPHRFTYPAIQVWLDPDDPDGLCDLHWAWSDRHPAPVRFRRRDYGVTESGSLGEAARDDLASVLGHRPLGPVRMLTQLRRWGWLFNPITVYFVWDAAVAGCPVPSRPIGAVVEVTNTPWKQRVRYPVLLECAAGTMTAAFDKEMHVSPFLGMDYHYELSVADCDDRIALAIDVVDSSGVVALETGLRLDRQDATRERLGRSFRTARLPTHRVSTGIHHQAARLWRKGVPFVPHPDKSDRDQSSHEREPR